MSEAGPLTVREAALAVMARLGLTTIFGNPGSTEISFLTDLPAPFRYVLALHEASVAGMATGYALGRGEPAFVNLHAAPGLGNAVNAIANARDCRAPLVVVAGQQDRRHLASEPFLAGRSLERLAGDYLVWSNFPARPQDVPGAIARAYHEAQGARGPALVVVPMGDWAEPADELAARAPATVVRSRSVTGEELTALADMLISAAAPVLVAGAGVPSDPAGWDQVIALAERLGGPVWQEPFASRAGFPHDHPLFAGDLPWVRARMREVLSGHDLVLTLGTSAFRGYLFEEASRISKPGTRVAVVTDDPAEAYRSAADLAVVGPVSAACAALVKLVPVRQRTFSRVATAAPAPDLPSAPDAPLQPGEVFAELALRLPRDTVLVEETPSTRLELLARIPPRTPLGLFSNGGGGLGFGLTGAIGLRFALPGRPVVAVVGDGSAMYTIQSLWSAVQYNIGILAIVMRNGRYAAMDELARASGGAGAWPAFPGIDVAGMAGCLGCEAVTVRARGELVQVLDSATPGLRDRGQPLLIQVHLGSPQER